MVVLESSALGQTIYSLFWLIFPGQHALKWIVSSGRVCPFSEGVSAQVLGCIHASSACAIATFSDMIDWAFHWLTPTERPCISFWAGISSDTKILRLPPKSCVLLPFQCYFWMIFSFMLLYLLQLNSYTLLLDLLRFSPAWLRPEGQQHQTSPAGTQLLSTPLTLCLLPRHGEGITCFVSPAPNDLCRLIKPSLSWDQGCLMSDHSMGRAPMATFIHRAFHKKRQIQAPCGHCADRYNPALPCSPYTQSWKLP